MMNSFERCRFNSQAYHDSNSGLVSLLQYVCEMRPLLSSHSSLVDGFSVAATQHDNEEHRFGDRKIPDCRMTTTPRSHEILDNVIFLSKPQYYHL